jgi:hypothetical protein
LFTSRNCEAALAYSRGQVLEGATACRSCKTGRGPFAKCIVVKGHLKGSCSNCHYNSEGARCSFRSLDSVSASSSTIAKQSKAPESEATTVPGTQNYQNQADQDSIIIPNDASAKSYQQVARRAWAVRKVKRKTTLKRELAILCRRIGDLLEEEADMLYEEVP